MFEKELDRIKKAYSSGLKVQIWFNGHWENFDAREYSMYKDPFSENRQYRIVGSDYADIAEKRIAELEMTVGTLRTFSNEQATCIERLQKENTELKEKYQQATDEGTSFAHLKMLERQLTKAICLLKNIIRVTWDAGWNYSLDWKLRTEQFLKEVE